MLSFENLCAGKIKKPENFFMSSFDISLLKEGDLRTFLHLVLMIPDISQDY